MLCSILIAGKAGPFNIRSFLAFEAGEIVPRPCLGPSGSYNQIFVVF